MAQAGNAPHREGGGVIVTEAVHDSPYDAAWDEPTKVEKINPAGGSGEKQGRDGWCTPLWIAKLVGWVNCDPCGNSRSHISAGRVLSLENGDNGLPDGAPGTFTTGKPGYYGESTYRAPPTWTVFVNPPYAAGQVIRWIRHWLHTRFIFLLRWDPSTKWFSELIGHCTHVWFPSARINFEPPPGVTSSSNPFPHALYLRRPTKGLLERLALMGYLFPVDSGVIRPQTSRHDQHLSTAPSGGSDCNPHGGPGGGEGGASPAPGGNDIYEVRSEQWLSPICWTHLGASATFPVV